MADNDNKDKPPKPEPKQDPPHDPGERGVRENPVRPQTR